MTTAAPPENAVPGACRRASPQDLRDSGLAAEGEGDWPRLRMDRAAIAGLAHALPVGCQIPKVLAQRRFCADRVLAWLESLPGQTWQQRWQASGCEAQGRDWVHIPAQFLLAASPAPIGQPRARVIAVAGMHAL